MQVNHSKDGGEMQAYRITSKTVLPKMIPVITIKDAVFAVKSDISFVAGPPKSGKTALVPYILATALTPDPAFDSMGIRSTYANGAPVIYFDTEQSRQFTQHIINTTNQLLGLQQEPDNLIVCNVRSQSRKERRTWIMQRLHEYQNAHLVIIDGVADLVDDPNNTTESFEVIDELMRVAANYNTCLVLYLHENPGNGKMRGHFGSEGERKCYGAITVRKNREKGYHSIESRLLRGSKDFTPIHFVFDPDLKRAVGIDYKGEPNEKEIPQIIKDKEFEKRLFKLAEQCTLGGMDHLDQKELFNRISRYDTTGKSKKTAQRRYGELTKRKMLVLDDDGKYCLNRDWESTISEDEGE